jgi:hypothetical protein
MILQTLKTIFKRFKSTKTRNWTISKRKSNLDGSKRNNNSAGNLCRKSKHLHSDFGNTNYARNRELEFSLKDIPKMELIRKIEETSIVVDRSLDKLTEKELLMEFPLWFFWNNNINRIHVDSFTTTSPIIFCQINYHRRLLEESSQ